LSIGLCDDNLAPFFVSRPFLLQNELAMFGVIWMGGYILFVVGPPQMLVLPLFLPLTKNTPFPFLA